MYVYTGKFFAYQNYQSNMKKNIWREYSNANQAPQVTAEQLMSTETQIFN